MDLYIVRPANIYGPYANFNPVNSMVVSSLIKRVCDRENPLRIWGDGNTIRDFIFSEDVANGMINVVLKNIKGPINLGSGTGYTIKKLIKVILSDKEIKHKPKIFWDKSKPSGDKKRVLDITKATKFNITNNTPLEKGIEKTIKWYMSNKEYGKYRYNYFLK